MYMSRETAERVAEEEKRQREGVAVAEARKRKERRGKEEERYPLDRKKHAAAERESRDSGET